MTDRQRVAVLRSLVGEIFRDALLCESDEALSAPWYAERCGEVLGQTAGEEKRPARAGSGYRR